MMRLGVCKQNELTETLGYRYYIGIQSDLVKQSFLIDELSKLSQKKYSFCYFSGKLLLCS